MLRITTSHSAEAAKNYFDVALKANDHYTKDVGTWGGKGAEILGLKGDVQRKDLVALANNRWLGANGKRLTARMNRTRLEDVIDKTGVPTIDVDETMAAIEARMETKVRKGIGTTIALAQTWPMQSLSTTMRYAQIRQS